MKKVVLAVGVSLLLAGCGDISKGDIEDAINAKINQSDICYSLQDNNVSFPVRVNAGFNIGGLSNSDAILKGLQNQGLLAISQDTSGWSRVNVLQLTEKGQDVSFWDKTKGVCVGHKAVDEVKVWTEPNDGGAQKMTQVTYTWKLDGIPGWVDKKAFADVKGISEPQEARIMLVKTNKGWQAM
ncbi:hypothetical protein [Winslowiella iniecta]|uniref:DNA-directed RNA polymerase, beta subunit n=1 Tax=Winslowiella iniecta TaxID=1560201 RepID=A0A0L7T6D5_9GAMM|nr:hypothetical protein [Winslowiella iniecta]KOC88718.1 dNA-directed RNA polymerase, beta subunit [Winslowiella iniecta]KOC90954.1 dNA-directed RNA polymerase, beta subunit [Winslowiella iniecta]